MPVRTLYNTLNRALHIMPLHARLPIEEYIDRTLTFTLTDRIKEFDFFEWKLDNKDGKLTRPEYLATGMVVMAKMGYLDGTTPWRAFIVNRLNGGVGVHSSNGGYEASMTDNEATITYHGRNRNAPGGRGSRKWSKRALPPPRRKKKVYEATSDITKLDTLLGTFKERRIAGKSTAEVVYNIARRNGFRAQDIVVQETNDHIDGYVLQEGQSDAEAVIELGRPLGFHYKLVGREFHWHSPMYSGKAEHTPVVLTYGDGQDILNLDIDADFRLPYPASITQHSPQPDRFAVMVKNYLANNTSLVEDAALLVMDGLGFGTRARPEKQLLLTGSPQMADLKAQQKFLRRNWNAFQINVRLVGNPDIMAGNDVVIRGTGSPLIDNRWKVTEARHEFTNNTYETKLKLKHHKVGKRGEIGLRFGVAIQNGRMSNKTKTDKGFVVLNASKAADTGLSRIAAQANRKTIRR